MKRKITITFLIAVLTMMMSFVFATDVMTYDTMLIAEEPPILIAPNPNSNKIKVQLDGEYVDFTDNEGNVVNPKIIQNRTMVPMRKIFEIFNAEINWNNETRTVIATTEKKEITLTINNDVAKLKDLVTNEEKEITLDSAPVLVDNRTMVPVRFIAESLEKEVGWDADEKTVVIIDLEKIVKEFEEKAPDLKKLFELEIEEVKSFKTESEIKGKIIYKDSEDKKNNETIELTGDLALNMNQENKFELYLDLEFDGKGAIYDALVEAGYKKVKLGMVIADSKIYVTFNLNGEEVWMDLGSELDMSVLEAFEIQKTIPKNYVEFVELLKNSLGELNATSYMNIKQVLFILESIFAKDTIDITTKTDKTVINIELDFKEILMGILLGNKNVTSDMDIDSMDTFENMNFKVSSKEEVKDKKVKSAEVTIEFSFVEPTTKESFSMDFELNMEYKNINKDFDISLPDVEVLTME